MRVRILRPTTGEVDGIGLSRFEVGRTYDLEASVATYLILTEVAEPIDEPQRPSPIPEVAMDE